MPELPEVETVKTQLERSFLNKKIIRSTLYRQDIRFPIPQNFCELTSHTTIKNIRRRSKYIILELDNNYSILLHLGMSGQVLIDLKYEEKMRDKHMHWVCEFDDKSHMIFRAPRRFGVLDIFKTDLEESHKLLKTIGPEPFSNHFNAAYLYEKLQHKKSPIKNAILDQRLVAGVGNIYVSEALYLAGIHPTRKANAISKARIEKLYDAILITLDKAIKSGGSSLKDFKHSDGSLGYFQNEFQVYDQENNPCGQCDCDGKFSVNRIIQSGRSTFYCPNKQK